jgi:hypothetical protein
MFRLSHKALECPVYFHINSVPSLTTTLSTFTDTGLIMENFVRISELITSEVHKQRKAYIVLIRDYRPLTVSVMESENKWMCCWIRGKENVNGFQSRDYLLTRLYESLEVKAT